MPLCRFDYFSWNRYILHLPWQKPQQSISTSCINYLCKTFDIRWYFYALFDIHFNTFGTIVFSFNWFQRQTTATFWYGELYISFHAQNSHSCQLLVVASLGFMLQLLHDIIVCPTWQMCGILEKIHQMSQNPSDFVKTKWKYFTFNI